MEDSHIIKNISTSSMPNHTFLSIFDGHAGGQTSKYLAENMSLAFERNGHWLEYCSFYKANKSIKPNGSNSNSAQTEHQSPPSSASKINANDEKYINLICEAFIETFLYLDDHLRSLKYESGSTGLCTLITPEYIFTASIGDSRAVLGTTKG